MLRKVAIDLGTTNILISLPGKGLVVQEPSVVALQAEDNKVLAIGAEAKEMLGRTPDSIVAAHPLRDGVIANYKITEAMLRYYLNRVGGTFRLFRPDIMVAVPAGITSTERKAVIDACIQAGAKNAYLIKEPLAAALGAGIPIGTASGHMIIDIGGGTTEVAVIALGDIVVATSVRVGGIKFDLAIANHIRNTHKLLIGEQTAEEVKLKIGAAIKLKKELSMEVSGSNAITGLPESAIVTSNELIKGIQEELNQIILAVKQVLQKTPPELAADVMDKGIVMTGGGSQLRGLDSLLTRVTGVPCQIADEPLLCVAKGTLIAAENLESFKRAIKF
ncbi:MAG: rod shape-determining protein MreB [Candidatus Berkelbacteria bacterium Gr01-1014_85]|uniref:Cell shape-determining protein MreB n=1 Tax=Candidatus Berkelbacteria bacterium Gr01-1014_85 TaxID=2017150 RepID=A0A554JCF1_9BACT|nr:MAG: rod shape-determining protein MreB [Candidatus Berkelbacteria bacterium Gr01-1014_85]